MTTLTWAEGFPLHARDVDPATVLTDRSFKAQRPYANGVTVYTDSGWLGNGFGNTTTKVAVRGTEIVGVYVSTNTRATHEVIGAGSLGPDYAFSGAGRYRRRYTTKTALSKWIAAVKAL